ncbi:DUF1353 domain-containing protein, partial [Gemmatimonas sp.]
MAQAGGTMGMASGQQEAPALSSSPSRFVGFLYPSAELPVTLLPGGAVRLEHAIVFADIDGIHVTPDQTVSDGTSSPAIAWPFLGHRLSYSLLPPSIQHDYQLEDALARRAQHLPHESRKAIDQRFYRALRAWGNGRVRAALHYAGTRLKALTIGPNWDGEGF